jgi:1,4-dihydroxy-2-naphthoyl-CoA hydrolase
MAIWKNRCSVKELNDKLSGSVQQGLGFKIAHIGDDFLVATLPMANNLDPEQQNLREATLLMTANTLVSIAAEACIDIQTHNTKTTEINISQFNATLNATTEGTLTAMARPVQLSADAQVWRFELHDEEDLLLAEGRQSLLVKPR